MTSSGICGAFVFTMFWVTKVCREMLRTLVVLAGDDPDPDGFLRTQSHLMAAEIGRSVAQSRLADEHSET